MQILSSACTETCTHKADKRTMSHFNKAPGWMVSFSKTRTVSLFIVPFWSRNHNVWTDVKFSCSSAQGSHHRSFAGMKSKPGQPQILTRRKQHTSLEGFSSKSGERHTATKPSRFQVRMLWGRVCSCVYVIVCGLGHMWSSWASPVLLIGSNGRCWGCSRWAWQQRTASLSTDAAPMGEQLQGFRFTLQREYHQARWNEDGQKDGQTEGAFH